MRLLSRILGSVLASAMLFGMAGTADAADYPTRPVTLVVPQAAGGTNDIVARALAQKLSENMGQSVVVENRAGANTAIATELAAKSAPDGHTILLNAQGHATNPALMKLGFDAMAEVLPELPRPQKGDLQHPDDCVREMDDAGFSGVTTHVFSSATRAESAEHYLRILARSGAPLVALRKRLGEAAWADVEARLLEALRRRIPSGGIDLAAEAILSVGTA